MPPGEQRPELREGYAFFYRQLGLAGPCPSAAAPKSSTLIMALFYPGGSGT